MYDRAADSYVCLRNQLVRRVNVASVPAPSTGHQGDIDAVVAFRPEGRFLATASFDRTTQLWENIAPSR
jgi:WD40 repeat protein